MTLFEEYAARCGLELPLVGYNNKSSLLLRSPDDVNPREYLLLRIDKDDEEEWCPVEFSVTLRQPVHDGYESEDWWADVFAPIDAYWEEYEEVLLKMVDSMGDCYLHYHPVKEEDFELAAWEMFLIIHDSWLAKHMDDSFFSEVESSLFKENKRDRFLSYRRSLRMILLNTSLKNGVANRLMPKLMDHSDWLENLVYGDIRTDKD
jgi:hypothetical protein